jgi:hypothetical protein
MQANECWLFVVGEDHDFYFDIIIRYDSIRRKFTTEAQTNIALRWREKRKEWT